MNEVSKFERVVNQLRDVSSTSFAEEKRRPDNVNHSVTRKEGECSVMAKSVNGIDVNREKKSIRVDYGVYQFVKIQQTYNCDEFRELHDCAAGGGGDAALTSFIRFIIHYASKLDRCCSALFCRINITDGFKTFIKKKLRGNVVRAIMPYLNISTKKPAGLNCSTSGCFRRLCAAVGFGIGENQIYFATFERSGYEVGW
ncbi:hypothetical protein EVAR_34485_1 [Eumeta japonica]|uniref:Uncharacterized protein n=1 Tax=Eumeta variegata TaxID=151549 RepID=A0A4C1WVU4_EUMVA|nr:hypothetical protein EVAR_34485_1 [Eumeta japonica]